MIQANDPGQWPETKSREIKFRGFGLNGGMAYGNLTILQRKYRNVQLGCYISNWAGAPFACAVRPETIGQFTGLKDKNGKEIYEGDICRLGSGMISPIIWKDGGLGYETYPGCVYADFHGFAGHQWLEEILVEIEVVGNIYENPDLIPSPPKNSI
jgi:hypothetical protein